MMTEKAPESSSDTPAGARPDTPAESSLEKPPASTRELLRALEFAHYAERFRESVFVIALPAEHSFQEMLLDFKVLSGYRIQVVLVAPDPEFRLEGIISVANKRGARFQLSLLTDMLYGQGDGASNLDFERVKEALARGSMPVIAYHASAQNFSGSPAGEAPLATETGTGAETQDETWQGTDTIHRLAGEVALRLNARKLFLVSPLAESLQMVLRRTSLQAGEMEGLPEMLARDGLEQAGPLCEFVRAQLGQGTPDVVVLAGRSGLLFQEVFTYEGAGVLFNATRETRIRQAGMKDVTDIALLIRPEIEAGRILPIDEGRIEAGIANYWLFEMDDRPVGLACLKMFGREAEMAQFTTLPRFRGKGMARELALHLIGQARGLGIARIFALAIDERMWEFFLSLQFQEVNRDELPEEWRSDYDMGRPSKAFRKEI